MVSTAYIALLLWLNVAMALWVQVLERAPAMPPGGAHVLFEQFWLEKGPTPLPEMPSADGEFLSLPCILLWLVEVVNVILWLAESVYIIPSSSLKATSIWRETNVPV